MSEPLTTATSLDIVSHSLTKSVKPVLSLWGVPAGCNSYCVMGWVGFSFPLCLSAVYVFIIKIGGLWRWRCLQTKNKQSIRNNLLTKLTPFSHRVQVCLLCVSVSVVCQCVLRPPVHPRPPSGAGEQCVSVAGGRQPVQSAGHLLLLLSHGDVHQGSGVADRSSEGQSLSSPRSCPDEENVDHRRVHAPPG